MHASDAADLLLAVMVPLQTHARAEIVEGAAQIGVLRRLPTNGDHTMGGIVRDIGRAATLREALAVAIGELPRLVNEITAHNAKLRAGLPRGARRQRPELMVELASTPFGRISIGFDRGAGLKPEAIFEFVRGRRTRGPFWHAPGDMLTSTRFGLPTLAALHDALNTEAGL